MSYEPQEVQKSSGRSNEVPMSSSEKVLYIFVGVVVVLVIGLVLFSFLTAPV